MIIRKYNQCARTLSLGNKKKNIFFSFTFPFFHFYLYLCNR